MTHLASGCVAFFLVTSCAAPAVTGPPSTPPSSRTQREPVECGPGLTCGPDEACIRECECCGIPVAPEMLRGSVRCEPLSTECRDPDADPAMCPRIIDHPCA